MNLSSREILNSLRGETISFLPCSPSAWGSDGNSLATLFPAHLQRTYIQSQTTTKNGSCLHFGNWFLFCIWSLKLVYWFSSILNYLKLYLYQSITDILAEEKIWSAWTGILNKLKLKRQILVETYSFPTSNLL